MEKIMEQTKSTKALLTMSMAILPLILVGILALGAVSCSGEKAADEQAESGQLWTCGMHPEVILEKPGNCPICGMKLTPLKAGVEATAASHQHGEQEQAGETQESMAGMGSAATETSGKDEQQAGKNGKKILYWRAPMDPTYISDKPGKSPMGMDLIPVYEDEQSLSSGSTIRIDPNVVLNIGVKTESVEVKHISREIRTVAHVDYNEQTLYRVNIKFSGWIEKLHVDETGQAVGKGDPMLEIYSPELLATQEEYLLAYKNAQKLKSGSLADIQKSGDDLLRAARQRLVLWDIEERQIRELEKTGVASKTMTLYAPANGIVISKHSEEGMRVMPGMDLFRIADLSRVWVYAHIFEYELPWVQVGDPVKMELPYIPGKIFSGKIKYIYPFLDKKTRDVKVRIEVPNPKLELKPEMYVNVRFKRELPEATPVIPSEAVIRTGKRNIVFIALGEGKFEPREVVLGTEGENNEFQVLSGLQGGENIVTSAQFLMDSESRLQEAIQKMLAARGKQ
jgi:Cu(I)/Ag(I) efflux system membrane fusion protein/cobalt-zinc-cadmium efflux system membrane fusion protein